MVVSKADIVNSSVTTDGCDISPNRGVTFQERQADDISKLGGLFSAPLKGELSALRLTEGSTPHSSLLTPNS